MFEKVCVSGFFRLLVERPDLHQQVNLCLVLIGVGGLMFNRIADAIG